MGSNTASAGGGAASGALAGAQVGSVVPGIGTAIGAGVGAVVGGISGYLHGRKKQKAAKKEEKRQERIRQIASPEHLGQVVAALQPLLRATVAAGLGPQFQEAVSTSLAQHGLTGTGVGEAMRTSAIGAPDIFASKAAMSEGQDVVRNQLSAEGLAGPAPEQPDNPLMAALLGGARGYMSGGGTFGRNRTPATNSAPAVFQGSNSADYTSLPNLTPQWPGSSSGDYRNLP